MEFSPRCCSDPTANATNANYVRLWLESPPIQFLMHAWSNTTAQETLNLKEIRKLPLLWPPKYVLEAFYNIVSPWLEQVENNYRQSETLATLRDTLLQKSLIDWSTGHSCEMNFRRGVRDVVFIPGFVHENRITYPITCKHHGRLIFQMRFLVNHSPFDQPAVIAELQHQLEQIPGWGLRVGMEGLPYVMLDELKTDEDRQKMLRVLEWIDEKLSTATKST